MAHSLKLGPLKLGLAGLGTVGAAVFRQIEAARGQLAERCGRPVVVTAVTARSARKSRGLPMAGVRWVADPEALARDPEIDCFVELMGGAGEPAHGAVAAALNAGKSVVTANKALIARHGPALAQLAEKNGVALNFEAAVGAAIPIVKTLREGLAGNRVQRVYGILNGTCNYILSRMEQERLSFAECLSEAQRLGYAEADPSFDIDGHDTAQKLAILASLAFGVRASEASVYVEGIASLSVEDLDAAADLGYRVKLLGVAMRTAKGIEQRVHPAMVPRHSAIAQVMGVTNAVTVDAEDLAPLTLVGPGAGGAATASAVVSDIADVARGARVAPFGRPVAHLAKSGKAPMERHEGGYYLRLLARDRPGAAAAIATRLAERGISIESIVQRHPEKTASSTGRKTAGPVPVILVTYATSEDAIRGALSAVRRDRVISGRPQVIRIEKN